MNKDIGLAFFVYKRPESTRRVLESIKLCGFKRIYVFQDGVRKETDRDMWEQVSRMIREIDFCQVEFFVSDVNKGLAQSIMDGMTYVFDKHDFAIALEDDVVLYPGYKEYMEYCSVKYGNNKSVMSVSGGGYGAIIPDDYKYDVVFTYRMSSVGFGTWEDRWKGFFRDPKLLDDIELDSRKLEALKKSGDDIPRLIRRSQDGSVSTWAAYWVVYQIYNLGFHVYPKTIFAEDIGRDGTGTNSSTPSNRYDQIGKRSVTYSSRISAPDQVVLDNRIVDDTVDLCSSDDPKKSRSIRFQFLFRLLSIRNRSLFFQTHNASVYLWLETYNKLYIWIMRRFIRIEAIVCDSLDVGDVAGVNVVNICSGVLQNNIPIIVLASQSYGLPRHYCKKIGLNNKLIYAENILRDELWI